LCTRPSHGRGVHVEGGIIIVIIVGVSIHTIKETQKLRRLFTAIIILPGRGKGFFDRRRDSLDKSPPSWFNLRFSSLLIFLVLGSCYVI